MAAAGMAALLGAANVGFLIAVAAAGVVAAVAVVAALDGRVIVQAVIHQGFHRLIRPAGHAAVELDPGLGQRVLGPGANAAADEDVHLSGPQEAGQGAMAAAGGVHHLAVEDPAQAHIVKLKLLGMAKVLEDLAVFIGHCNAHLGSFFLG